MTLYGERRPTTLNSKDKTVTKVASQRAEHLMLLSDWSLREQRPQQNDSPKREEASKTQPQGQFKAPQRAEHVMSLPTGAQMNSAE